VNTSDSQYAHETITNHYTTLLQALCDLAEAYYRLGRLEDASHVLSTGMPFLEGSEVAPHDVVKVLLSSGKILVARNFQLLSDYELTLPTLVRAKELAESITDERSVADALELLGEATYYKKLWTNEGAYETALAYFQQALERREMLADYRGMSESWFFIGIIAERQQQPDQALDSYAKALQIAEHYGYKLEKAETLRHIAGIALERNDLEKAEQYFAESLALREERGFKIGLPYALLSVGNVSVVKGDLAQALAQYEEAYRLAEEMQLVVVLIFSLLSIGELRKEQGDIPQARASFEKAHAAAEARAFQFALAASTAQLEELERLSAN